MNAQASKPLAIYPFVLELDHVVIDASINGRPGRFALDSGCGAAAITSGFADDLEIRFSEKSAVMSGAGKGNTQGRMGAADLAIGELTLRDLRVVVLGNDPFQSAGSQLNGVLGYDLLAKWTITIDFADKTLAFFEPSNWVASGGLNIPVDISKRVPVATVEIRPVEGTAPCKATVMLDTGAATFPLVLSSDFAARAGLDQIRSRREILLGFGTNGPMMGDLLRVAEANVHGLSLRDVFVGVSRDKTGFFASGIADGIIGQAMLRRGRLTFDYARSRVLFEPGEDIAGRWDYPDHCGWAFRKDAEGDWSAVHIAEGCPAAEAGLVAGDKIIELGGQGTGPFSRDELREIGSGEGLLDGKRLRDNQLRAFHIHRRKLI